MGDLFASTTLTTVISQLVAALVALVGFSLRNWSQQRNFEHRYRAEQDRLREDVLFTQAWYSTYAMTGALPTGVPNVAARAQYHLEEAYSCLAHSEA